jgi:hypothetical protein
MVTDKKTDQVHPEGGEGTSESKAASSKNLFTLVIIIIVLLVIIIPLLIATLVMAVKGPAWLKQETPPLPGVMPSIEGKRHLILAQDIDYPPYAYLGSPPESNYEVAGIGHDFAMGMAPLCDFDITVVQTKWSNCWDSGKIGPGLLNGYYHACMTYTHT